MGATILTPEQLSERWGTILDMIQAEVDLNGYEPQHGTDFDRAVMLQDAFQFRREIVDPARIREWQEVILKDHLGASYRCGRTILVQRQWGDYLALERELQGK